MSARVTKLVAAIVLIAAVVVPAVRAQGTIKGQVIWSDKKVPANPDAKVDKDKAHCLSKGAIKANELIVDPKSKGLKNVVFFLVDAKDPSKKLPITAGAKNLPKTVEIDQPCCEFMPRLVVIAPGQKLVVKNSAPIPHNTNIIGGSDGPNLNQLIPAGGKMEVGEGKSRLFAIPYSCSIHAWMKGYIIAAPSPYYAITDKDGNFVIKNAPKGNYKLVGWHEKVGWIFPAKTSAETGKVIEIKEGGTTDVGKLPRKVEDDD